MLKAALILLVFLSAYTTQAQVTEEEQEQQKDTIGYNQGKVELDNPPSIVEAYTYDAATDRYVYTNSVGGFNINYPIILTPKEYQELVMKESMHKYFKEKADAIDGKKPGSEAAKKDLLPRYYVNSSFFETIFGSNTIDVKPTGSVEMDLGVRYTKQDNPAFSPRNRSSITFDFDQRISLALQGKVGTRLNVNANYDTESTFAFQNLIKLEYAPTEDDILQKIEVGNVSLPLNSTLIKGAQSLFGVKAQFQFGKTTITGIFSEQKSQTKAVTAQGGGTIQEFDIFALDYDADRHFFLSQYFRNRYDAALSTYPILATRVQITRVEVWVTNKQNRVSTTENNLRNIVALQDLGEAQLMGFQDNEIVNLNNPTGLFNVAPDSPTDNANNKFDPGAIGNGGYLNNGIREIATTNNGAFSLPAGAVVNEGQDYSKLENARKLTPNEYTLNAKLGYISLQQKLANDEVLAVAYEYTIGDKSYQVGEFGNDGVESTVVTGTDPATQTISTQSLVLKMLKSNLTSVNNTTTGFTTPVFNLMMKNIYQVAPGGQLEQEDFRFNILYSDPSPLNYITAVNASNPLPEDNPSTAIDEAVNQTPLLRVFNVDKLNATNDIEPKGDGFFDFIPGLTVDSQNGRIIFTTVEPFGKFLFNKLANGGEDYNNTATYNPNQAKYVFRQMYRSTQAGALQNSDKNKFELRGKYKSTSGDGIAIGAYNVPRGSVVVTAGGRVLTEGVDYSVNYQLGRVQILDPSLQASNTPIQISLENNSVFGQQTRRFMGVNVEHKFSDKFVMGATFLKMTERPFTQKSSYGQESVNNSIFGFNTNYATEVPFLTRLVNKLPNVDTDVVSNISFRGEIAYLKPDTPKADQFEGESTIYVDDFEGSQTTIDMKSSLAWSLSSVPKNSPNYNFGFQSDADVKTESGYKRAKLSWYTIDPIFYTSQRPGGITDQDMSLNRTRRVYIKELFPQEGIADGQQTVINTFDMTYYPTERGPYNYSTVADGNTLPNPSDNFGGVMRSVSSTNFEQSNVEYIQFWMIDPYYLNDTDHENLTNTGRLFFNLGEISEDVLSDGKKQYENGLPEAGSNQNTLPTPWGRIPASQSLIYAFDTNNANRAVQDVGLDGVNDDQEANLFPTFAGLADPAADNYTFYLNADGNVIQRYKEYNGMEKNSPVGVSDNNRGNATIPDVEDINRDNTMSTIDAYYQYSVRVEPNMQVGQNYITDERTTEALIPGPGNQTIPVRWLQFKIPINDEQTEKVGPIEDFRSIRFMRMFLTGFSEEVTLRFGTLDLVRGEWRRYTNTLDVTDPNITDDNTGFDVLAVNLQENDHRIPINYVSPPGVVREQLYNNNTVINQNEQSLALRISDQGLEAGDSRAVFKNVSVDMRQYNKLKMFMHAESLPIGNALGDKEFGGFIRFGNDFTQNYYQVELPLLVTAPGASTAEEIWPEENNVDLKLALLTKLKIMAMQHPEDVDAEGVYSKYEDELDESLAGKTNKLKLSIKGNPNFGLVRTLMVGIKNERNPNGAQPAVDNRTGEVWFNELRLSGMDNKGGMAAVASFDSNLADFATISATGKISTIGFGALEDGPNERSREDLKQYNIVTNINLGKLLPKKWGINLPFNYGVGEEIITPEYDPFNQDIKLQQLLDITDNAAERDNIENRAIEYTKTKSINFIGVKKERGADQKPHVYDPENLTLSYSFNETKKHDYEIEDYVDQQLRTSVDYTYTFSPKPIEPLKNNKFLKKSSYWKLLTDFNFNYLPSNISFGTTILRQYNRQQFRQVDDVEGLLAIDPLYRRNFLFNYQYGFNYNLTKALKMNYAASSSHIVRNYFNEYGEAIDSFTIWDDYWNTGEPNQFNQQLTVNYDLPLNKLPFLSFFKSTYTYTGDYAWQRSSDAMHKFVPDPITGISYDLGNTIQNNSSHKLNTTLNMDLFYKYIGLTKGAKSKKPTPKTAVAPPKPGQKVAAQKPATEAKTNILLDGLIGVLTSVKNIQLNYTETAGTVLPGYLPGVGFFGSSKPSLGFVFGAQDDVRQEAAERGWLTNYGEFNQNYTEVTSKTLDATANIDLFPDFKIDLKANRSYMNNFSEQFDVTNGTYNSLSPYNFGNFSISTILISTAFGQSDENGSAAFDEFRSNRLIIADRLAGAKYGANIPRYGDAANPIPTDVNDPLYTTYVSNAGYPIGYKKNSQEVLLPAFLAAYTGSGASGISLSAFRNVPLPNWTVKYSGLMRYKFFKDRFKRFSLQHGYTASYTVNSFRSNFDYDKNQVTPDPGENFNSKSLISNVNLVEQFNPLIKMDMEMKNSMKFVAELKKDRALSMSFDNNLLTEVKGLEYILGVGYRIKDVIFNSTLADNPQGIIKSDINIKVDFSLRNTKTIVRYLDYDNNQLAGGQNLWSAKVTADYSFSKSLTAIFYYDHSFSKAVISTAFPITNIRAGFTLRYNFGN
ncbi:MAG: cell surface protein SprA [Flavobacterium sp.]|nr:cell surface protein SprA [Flavobacterium sp.]